MIKWFNIISKYILPGPDIFVKNEMLTSMRGIDKIKEFEGFRSTPYLCSAKVPTIGYGSTRYANGDKVSLSDGPITQADATGLLKITLRGFEDAVNSFVTRQINQQQFDALVSLCYNIGTQAFRKSTLLRKINANPNDPTIRNEFLRWNKADGKSVAGLTTRRNDEAEMYFEGVY